MLALGEYFTQRPRLDRVADFGSGAVSLDVVDVVAVQASARERTADDVGLSQVSMGMTDDLEVALAEGSTMVRVGRALFGDRPPRT